MSSRKSSPENEQGKNVDAFVPDIININTATLAELEILPGIGEIKALSIIEYRAKHGLFRSLSDIQNVNGIGPTIYEGLKDLVTIGTFNEERGTIDNSIS